MAAKNNKKSKKVSVKTKKKGKTVTFQAKPKTDPFKTGHRPNDPKSNDPKVCECGNLDCPTTRHLQPRGIAGKLDITRELVTKLRERTGAGATDISVINIPLNTDTDVVIINLPFNTDKASTESEENWQNTIQKFIADLKS